MRRPAAGGRTGAGCRSEGAHGAASAGVGAAMAVVVAVVAGVTLAGCGSGRGPGAGAPRRTTTSVTSTHTSTTPTMPPPSTPTAPATSAPGGTPTSVTLTLVACATSYGVTPSSVPTLPATMAVAVPTQVASQVSVYADAQGFIRVVAPSGWDCSALIGADGSTAVSVYPPTEAPTGGTPPTAAKLAEAVTGTSTSACVGCALYQTCAYFSSAAQSYVKDGYGSSCPSRPSTETVTTRGATAVTVEDPAGVKGAGLPSGGANAAVSVMTYVPTSPTGSYLGTCTLPGTLQQVCTAMTTAFTALYGTK